MVGEIKIIAFVASFILNRGKSDVEESCERSEMFNRMLVLLLFLQGSVVRALFIVASKMRNLVNS